MKLERREKIRRPKENGSTRTAKTPIHAESHSYSSLLELAAQHIDHVIRGDDAGELILVVDDRQRQ
jgi:hypothetical protein